MSITLASINAASIGKLANAQPADGESGLPITFSELLSLYLPGSTPEQLASNAVASSEAGSNGIDTKSPELLSAEPEHPMIDEGLFASMLGLPQALPPQKPTDIATSTPAEETKPGLALGLESTARGAREETERSRFGVMDNNKETRSFAANMEEKTGKMTNNPANLAADTPATTVISENSGLTPAVMQSPQRDTTTVQQALIETPVNSKAWPEQLGNKVVWLVRNEHQTAQINVTPPQLGPIHITLNLNGDQASAFFVSPHADVRQAIESSMPQLRDMLAASGITLGDANVGSNMSHSSPNPQFASPNKNPAGVENAILSTNDSVAGSSSALVQKSGNGLVDLFA